ncbi:MAG: thiamine phosphate synthase [Pseudomonadota bacterium]
MALTDYRSRLFLITPQAWPDDLEDRAEAAFSGGDIACILLEGTPDQTRVKDLTASAQAQGIAVLIADDTQLAGRVGADGVHMTDPKQLPAADIAKRQEVGEIVGCAGINTRHLALEMGERGFDYLFFGRTDRPIDRDTHPKTRSLSSWWAQMMTVPCVAISGSSDDAFEELAASGVEFIAIRDQIWDDPAPAERVRRYNSALDKVAQKRMNAAA